jgi:hypothetical protein
MNYIMLVKLTTQKHAHDLYTRTKGVGRKPIRVWGKGKARCIHIQHAHLLSVFRS